MCVVQVRVAVEFQFRDSRDVERGIDIVKQAIQEDHDSRVMIEIIDDRIRVEGIHGLVPLGDR